jgi:hypothetical protein
VNPGPDPQPLHIRPIMRGHVVRQGASDRSELFNAAKQLFNWAII